MKGNVTKNFVCFINSWKHLLAVKGELWHNRIFGPLPIVYESQNYFQMTGIAWVEDTVVVSRGQ